MIFIMAAPLVYGTGDDDDKKQWSSVEKLIGSSNFILWYSTLGVAMMGMTSDKWQHAKEIMDYVYANPEKVYGQIKTALSINAEDMKEPTKALYLAVFQTTSNRKQQLKILLSTTYSGKGVEAFQHL